VRTEFPLRRRIKKEEKEKERKSIWNTQKYTHTKKLSQWLFAFGTATKS
jgi:hypothetical protein